MSKIYGIELNLVYGFHIKKKSIFFCEIVNFFYDSPLIDIEVIV